MKTHPWINNALRRLVLAQACAVFGISISSAQLAPTTAPSPEQLAKYDKNKNGVLDPDELAAMRNDQTKPAVVTTTAVPADESEAVQLSPFEVVADTKGYFASNTLSGTRLNSKIEDLGASITAITKQQLLDTAALDINDVFLYESNTEGSGQFTDQSVDFQGRVLDNVQSSPATANRIRGLSAANISTDGFSSSSRIPFDTYNLDSIEISRGPNSSLSGLGDAGGTVNLNQSRANLARETTQLTIRGDDWGGYRTSVDLSRPVIKDKLAVRVTALYDSKGFRRKPSADIQRRLFGALTYKPFAGTTLTGSFESFHEYRRTPNAMTPTDMISDWLSGGKPTWDPITSTAKLNGVSVGTFANANAENTALPRGLGRDAFFDNYPSMFIDRDGKVALYTMNRLQTAGAFDTTNVGNSIRLMTTYSDVARNRQALYPIDNLVGVSNKAIYDYEHINAVATNWNRDSAKNYKLQLEQKLFDTAMNKAYVQLAWRLEDSTKFDHNTLNETTNLYIDVNERLLDGTANPFFLRPYVNTIQKTFTQSPIYNDTVRAQLSYELDLRKQKKSSLLALLGRHQVLGYYEANRTTSGNYGYREAVTDNVPWINPASRYNSHGNITDRFYIGDNQGSNLDYAPALSNLPSGAYTFHYATNVATVPPTFTDLSVNVNGLASGGATQNRVEVHTRGGALQSFFWDNRFVTTLGYRDDAQRNRSTVGAVIDPTTGFGNYSNLDKWGTWTEREGKTKTYGAVLRPFNGWKFVETKRSQGGAPGAIADLLDGFQVHYNHSDSFKPASPAVNIFGDALPNPNGVGKDYGFSLRMMDGKFVARVNWYETTQVGARLSGQYTLPVIITAGFEVGPTTAALETFARSVITGRPAYANATEAQIQSAIYDFVQLPQGFYDKIRAPISVNDINNQLSKGTEIELNYNPSRNLTFKVSAAQTKTIDLSLIDATARFIAQRMPIWTTIKNDQGQLWWGGVATNNPNLYNNQVKGNILRMTANLGQPRSQIKEWTWNAITTYRFTTGKLNGLTVGSTIRWADKSSIGFQGIKDADGIIRTFDFNKPVYDPARDSYDFMANYNLKFFGDKVRTRIQLNCKDAFAHQGLRATAWQPEGYPSTFRIVDGRQWILTTTFDL